MDRPWPVHFCCFRCSDVVDLPDVLLPEGQYLDMFDLESYISGDLSDVNWLKFPR